VHLTFVTANLIPPTKKCGSYQEGTGAKSGVLKVFGIG
jgi:hypothetical protein